MLTVANLEDTMLVVSSLWLPILLAIFADSAGISEDLSLMLLVEVPIIVERLSKCLLS